jgi:sigma-E factor negative regulatory protein RseA
VLRSDDLAVQPARDAAFLQALRARLADEPVVLAPAPLPAQPPAPAAARRRHAWVTPAAVAAGFMAVAGVLVVARMAGPGEAEAPLLVIGGPSAQSGIRLTGGQGAAAGTLVVEGRVIRDAQLDAYLRAHREAMGGAPVALPGGVPRNIATLEPEGPAAAVPASAVR